MKCIICGKQIEKSSYSNAVLCSSECFHVNYWNTIVKEKHKHVFIKGECMAIGDEDPTNRMRGFGGHKFSIKILTTGEIIETTNLWYQGVVPESHKELLPDTAEFVR